MSKLDGLNLPELPEGMRWRVVEDFALKSPKIRIEKLTKFFGWRKVTDRYISTSVWPDVEVAIKKAAVILRDEHFGGMDARKYMD